MLLFCQFVPWNLVRNNAPIWHFVTQQGGKTALILAAANDQLTVVQQLLQAGANVNLQDKVSDRLGDGLISHTLYFASRNNNCQVINYMFAAIILLSTLVWTVGHVIKLGEKDGFGLGKN